MPQWAKNVLLAVLIGPPALMFVAAVTFFLGIVWASPFIFIYRALQ